MSKILPISSGENFRELGGYQTKEGYTIKFHKLIRAASLNSLTTADSEFLSEYGVRTIVDFRSSREKDHEPDQIIPKAKNFFVPVFEEDETKNSVDLKEMTNSLDKEFSGANELVYANRHFIENKQARAAYAKFFELLLANETDKEAVLFHCTAGKDRTGFGAAMFLEAVGVDREIIFDDYLLTNKYYKNKPAQMKAEMEKNGISKEGIAEVQELFKARRDYLQEAYRCIDQLYGTVHNYLADGLSITDSDISKLKRIYLQ